MTFASCLDEEPFLGALPGNGLLFHAASPEDDEGDDENEGEDEDEDDEDDDEDEDEEEGDEEVEDEDN